MKTKKVLTANLKPGMVSSEAAYTYTNHLVIQSNTTLTAEIIEKLKYYAIKSVRIYLPEEKTEEAPKEGAKEPASTPVDNILNFDGPTYFERVQQTEQFVEFKDNFTSSVGNFKDELNDIVVKNSNGIVENMLKEVDSIVSRTRNSLHLLDMMQCLRGFDDLTYMHSMNVALICNVIGGWAGFSTEDLNTLMLCGLLHDIGKLKIPPEIIQKPGKLTNEEFELVRSHPKLGYEILRSKSLDDRVKLSALQHHERYDGTGYPRELTGIEMAEYASIVAIADVYDAMTSNRIYRKGICPFTVISMFEKEKDLYNPHYLYLFMKHLVEAYVNTEVVLSNGERGRIVLLNQNLLSRPVVITDKKTYDLSRDFSVEIATLI